MAVTSAITSCAGGSHTCAVIAGSTVSCWGENDRGQLGNGTTTDAPGPSPVVF